MRRTCALAVAVCVAVLSTAAYATPVTFRASGEVTFVSDDPVLAHGVSLGDQFTATYTFDTDAPDLAPADPTLGVYRFNSTLAISAGPVAITFSGFEIFIASNRQPAEVDQYGVGPITTTTPSDPVFSIFLGTAPHSGVFPLGSDALSETPPDVASFTGPLAAANFSVDYHLTPSVVTPGFGGKLLGIERTDDAVVPEPGTLALMGFGVAVLGHCRRRKAKSR